MTSTLPTPSGRDGVDTALVKTDRPGYRPFLAVVSSVARLSDHFVRVEFTGPDFAFFGTDGLDQRIKIVFPLPGVGVSDLGITDEDSLARGEWYDLWRALPDESRNPFRTYTVRAIDAATATLTVDFVVHDDGADDVGPATRWLRTVEPGSELVIVGPDARSIHSALGIDWRPGTATRVVLSGDETAAPAICAVLESLSATVDVTAFIEIPTSADQLPLAVPDSFAVHWLARDGEPVGSRLVPTLEAWIADNRDTIAAASAPRPQELEDIDVDVETLWDSPDPATLGGFYAWLAGESAVIKTLRRMLVTGSGVDRKRVAFMGYWRLGQSEKQG